MNTISYTLGNGEERHDNHPETFWIPDRKDRETIPTGRHVKLMFNSSGMTEQMWVRVTGGLSDGRYTGLLANVPAVISAKFGDVVEFKPEHIIDILSPSIPLANDESRNVAYKSGKCNYGFHALETD